MKQLLETSPSPAQSSSITAVRARAARLLWFLMIPAALLIGAFFTVKAREASTQQLAKSTDSLAKETVSVLHATRGEPVSSINP